MLPRPDELLPAAIYQQILDRLKENSDDITILERKVYELEIGRAEQKGANAVRSGLSSGIRGWVLLVIAVVVFLSGIVGRLIMSLFQEGRP